MKYNFMQVTFWFNEIDDFKKYQKILDEELNKDFSPFNLIGVPTTVDFIIPRITSNTIGGHTKFNMSKINVQLITNFDNDFIDDFDKCYEYVKNRAFTIFNILKNKCNLKILYSAINLNCEKEDANPIEKILTNIFNTNVNSKNICEAGVKLSQKINNKYYYIISLNDAKMVSLTKKIEQGTLKQNIIIPLISEKKLKIEKTLLAFSIEVNDKCNFNNFDDYNTELINLEEMFKTFYNKNINLKEQIDNNTIL